MALSISSLLGTVTETAALARVMSLYSSLGLRVTSWVSGGLGLTVAHILAKVLAEHSLVVQEIVKSGFLEWAEGDWLTLLAKDFYDTTRYSATRARHTVRLTCTAAAGPYTLTASQVWCSTSSGVRFRAVTGGVLAAGGTLDITVEAELAGTGGNVPAGSITVLVTSLPGVTVTNTATVQLAVAEESDPLLRGRCRDKWASVAPQDAAPGGTYRYWARRASTSVTRVFIDDGNPDGPGTLRVYLASSVGGVASDVVTAVNTELQARRAMKAVVSVQSAVEVPCVLTGQIYVSNTTSGEAYSAVVSAVTKAFSEFNIGGELIGGERGIWGSRIIDAIHDCGVDVRRIYQPVSWDFYLAANQVGVPQLSIGISVV